MRSAINRERCSAEATLIARSDSFVGDWRNDTTNVNAAFDEHDAVPFQRVAQNILRKLEDEKADENVQAVNGWRADCERAKIEHAQWQDQLKAAAKDGLSTPPLPANAKEPDKPHRRRYVVQDATPESLGSILVGNPEGTLMVSDELAGWLETFDAAHKLINSAHAAPR